MTNQDPRPTEDDPDDDPRLWLEEIEGEAALAWVADVNRRTAAHVGEAVVAREAAALRAVLDRPGRIAHIRRRGGLVYNVWKDERSPRGLWRRTTLASYRTGTPAWDVLLDLDRLAADEGEDWVWHGAVTAPPRHARAIVSLSRGGGDAAVLREFDLPARRFVPDGFHLQEAKGGADWLDDDTLLLTSAHGDEDRRTRAGYARTVRVWRRGTAVESADTVFAADPAHLGAGAWVDRTAEGERLAFVDHVGFFDRALWLGDRAGPRHRVAAPTDCRLGWSGDWAWAQPRTDWRVGGLDVAAGSAVGLRLSSLLPDGPPARPQVLFAPGERRALEGAEFVAGRLLLTVLDELRTRFGVWTPDDAGWTERPIAGVPDAGVLSASSLDVEPREADGTLMVTAADPVTPTTLLLAGLDGGAPAILARAPAAFDAAGLAVTRHEAVSFDGERIPYTVTGPARPPDGEAPVHLTGYGGFEVSVLPGYDTVTGKLWLERGGTAVVASIRGGGEFGTRWHEAGRGVHKHRAHEDFAAVASDLVRRGITRPGRIAAEGGSNGGLLIANMFTRFPDRFGALFCTIPLTDMRRYTRLLAGASWIAEYGDPDRPEDWAHLRRISAYHATLPPIGSGVRHPPILVATSRRDDRVHPGHARKFAHKLQALGLPAFFHEPTRAVTVTATAAPTSRPSRLSARRSWRGRSAGSEGRRATERPSRQAGSGLWRPGALPLDPAKGLALGTGTLGHRVTLTS